MNKKLFFILLIAVVALQASAKNIYVATDGSDANTGSISSPYGTIRKAVSAAAGGDSIFLRAGTYYPTESEVMEFSGIFARVYKMSVSGTAARRTFFGGYRDERPIIDMRNVKPANYRVYVFFVNGSYWHFRNFEVIGTQVTITGHTQSECFHHEGGNYCLYENLSMHDGMAIGFYITKGSNNLVLNCDAYNNWDNVSEDKKGGNTDGFGGHVNSENYTGNVFRGCRAWFNSDDGFDLINCKAAFTMENCWAFKNGYSTAGAALANGAGFKSGGYGMSETPNVPNPIPRHVIRFCLAVNNKNQGFYANHHLGGLDFYNNTAYKNPVNFNMLCRKAVPIVPATDVDGYGHNIKNNVSYQPNSSHASNLSTTESVVSNNSWNNSFSLSDSDFQSTGVDMAQLTAARQADGSLPDISLLKPSATSRLIDKGVDIGFAFEGAAPDLGYAEYAAKSSVTGAYVPDSKEIKKIEYYNLLGQPVCDNDRSGELSGTAFYICKTTFDDNSVEVYKKLKTR